MQISLYALFAYFLFGFVCTSTYDKQRESKVNRWHEWWNCCHTMLGRSFQGKTVLIPIRCSCPPVSVCPPATLDSLDSVC